MEEKWMNRNVTRGPDGKFRSRFLLRKVTRNDTGLTELYTGAHYANFGASDRRKLT